MFIMFFDITVFCLKDKYNREMIRKVCLDNSTLELSIYNSTCDEMVNGSCCVSYDSSGFIYCWNHIVRKHLIQKIFYLFIIFKVQNFNIEVSYIFL